MANKVLLASSLLLALVYLAILLSAAPLPRLFFYTVLCGMASSVINHACTSPLAKWLDRALMVAGALADLAYLAWLPSARQTLLAGLLAGAIACYTAAKLLVMTARGKAAAAAAAAARHAEGHPAGNLPHLAAHVLLTLLHCTMTRELAQQCAPSARAAAAAGLLCW